MSDFLVVRGLDDEAAAGVLNAWAAPLEWVRSVALRDAWEPRQLEINRRNAREFMRGKHKAELAELVTRLGEHGGRVVHVMLHRPEQERQEQDLGPWAERVGRRSV